MTTDCPPPLMWSRLLDADLPERDAHGLRLHAVKCPSCSARLAEAAALLESLSRPVFAADPAAVRQLMARVASAGPSSLAVGRWALAAVALMLAVVAGAAALRPWARPGDESQFAARGGSTDWRGKARAEIRLLHQATRPMPAEVALSSRSELAVWYRNVESGQSLYLLAYLLDGAGEVHWVFPTWGTGQPPPEAARLPRAEGEALMPDSFVAEHPAAGAGTLVTVISPRPLSVLTVEQRPAPSRSDTEAMFPDGLVWRQAVQVEP